MFASPAQKLKVGLCVEDSVAVFVERRGVNLVAELSPSVRGCITVVSQARGRVSARVRAHVGRVVAHASHVVPSSGGWCTRSLPKAACVTQLSLRTTECARPRD